MQSLVKGITTTIQMSFRSPAPTFTLAPEWELIDPNGIVLVSGTSVPTVTAGTWELNVTVPITYETADGDGELTLELFGTDTLNKVRSTERQYNLIDVADDFLPAGVLFTDNRPTLVSMIHDDDTLTAGNFRMYYQDHNGNNIVANPYIATNVVTARVANMTDVPDRFTDPEFSGYRYDISFSALSYSDQTYGPQQMYIQYGDQFQYDYATLAYPLHGKMRKHVLNLKMYLDKARLNEIDPTLQWQDEELAHAVYEGFSYVNSFPDTHTFWTPEASPLAMDTYFWYAAAVFALNTRYLAEGFNSFQFTGASTQLDFDRTQYITYKIEELKGYLETNLEKAKAAAIRTYGIGTRPAGENAENAVSNLGVLGLHVSQVNNVYKPTIRSNAGNFRYR